MPPKPKTSAADTATATATAAGAGFLASLLASPQKDSAQPAAEPRRESLGDVLRNLSAERRILDQLDDQLSGAIRRVEEALRQHVAVRIEHRIANDEDSNVGTYLTFGKLDGKWQLQLEVIDQDDGELMSQTALVNASRERRANVFVDSHIDALVRGAREQLGSQIAVRKRALLEAQRIIEALGALPSVANSEDE